ncbi:Aste57867_18538 [Aphanomyces stellatus]|uniref:Aste57867_18538 protein n=1 Tax=Aphanomyces stellatus TaxID=120398 RepID=A0A485LB79_9STRA|nr:hypothetical protein As57867_018476 [Aphanomyces stellatus]VFT95274.1 Aste57867_18538 [Aphanomyces stellatus]
MHRFLHVHVPRRHHVDLGRHISSLTLVDYHCIMANDVHPVISSWLDAWDMTRLLKLFDCLPFVHGTVLEYAPWSGNFVILDWFQTIRRHDILPSRSLIGIAVVRSQLHVLEWLSAWGYRNVISENLMHAAIQVGNLRMIRYLHDAWDVPVGCAMDIMTAKCRAEKQLGQHLHDLGTYKCTTAAIDNIASARGDIEIASWLHANRNERCTTSAMDNASREGHLDMMRWLHAN